MRLARSSVARTYMDIRTYEQHAMTTAIAVRAASHLSPVIRLPPSINHVMPAAIQFADCIRGWKPKLSKVKKTFDRLRQELVNCIDNRLMQVIDQPHSHIKIISDIPLEWLPIRRLPLMLRSTVSRIPCIPGNLTFVQIPPPPPLRLSMADFAETLIIRSFKVGDPLRTTLKECVDAYRLPDDREIPAKFVDVRSKSELIAALNSFEGAFIVFDCHGSHRKQTSVGVLNLTDEDVDLWSIRELVRVPPIVFTCACDTHALGRSHATCGNGLLYCGARTVIASVLPIHGGEAAIFCARLLFRMYMLLPAITSGELRWSVRWDGVITLLQRMMYMSSVVRLLEKVTNQDDWGQQAEQACIHIIHNSGSEWYEIALQEVSKHSGVDVERIEKLVDDKLPFAESLKYLQMGNPETIVVGPESLDPDDYYDNDYIDGDVETDAG